MASEEQIQSAIDDLIKHLGDVADDTGDWSQGESAQIWEAVAEEATMRAQTIRGEMG